MKKLPLLLLAIAATLLSGVGAHSLANLCDPTYRGDRITAVTAAAPSCGTQPCMDCNYYEV